MLHCDGQCYLAKKMAEAREKEKSERGSSSFVDYTLLQIDWIERFNVQLFPVSAIEIQTYAYVNTHYNFNFQSQPFMPPKAA